MIDCIYPAHGVTATGPSALSTLSHQPYEKALTISILYIGQLQPTVW